MPISPSADDHAQVTIVTFISVTLSFLNHFFGRCDENDDA